MSGRIRVLIAEDEPSVREALAALIQSEPDLVVVGTAGDAFEAIELARKHRPDVAVLDVKMPGGGGPRAARAIRAFSPQTRVTALSAYDDRSSVLEMLGAGAVGYLVKGTSAGQILDAIRCSARGHGSLSSEVTADVIKTLAGQLKQEEFETLRRQSEVRQVQRLLEGQGFWLLFQPVLDLVGGGLIGYEALARFDPERTRPPTVWFERAAALGMLTELEMVTVRGALARLGAIPPESFLAVNVSPSTVASAPFLETLSGVPGERIVLEVTEHARVDDYDALNEALRRLRSRGVRLAIDDAGAGFASLQHIVRLAPDYIKLDITLTRGIDADPVRRALATALITFAHEIGASMIAEGIETDAEFETLRALGVAFGQGFFLGEPGPLHQQDAFPDPSPTPLDAWIPSVS